MVNRHFFHLNFFFNKQKKNCIIQHFTFIIIITQKSVTEIEDVKHDFMDSAHLVDKHPINHNIFLFVNCFKRSFCVIQHFSNFIIIITQKSEIENEYVTHDFMEKWPSIQPIHHLH